MRRRRGVEEFSLSFLDVISCGFGAIILLLVITKVVEPVVLEQTTVHLEGVIADLQEQLFEIRGETKIFNRELTVKREQLAEDIEKLARLQGELYAIQGRFLASTGRADESKILDGRLASARQSLTEEMKRLFGIKFKSHNNIIGGIPVDSEYIIFVIDTSGSMYNYAWNTMIQKLQEVLNVYPDVKGIQVLNDMGDYMFSRYQGRWIPDTPARRRSILQRIRTWNPFSNSSPQEGIERAIRTYWAPDKKISIYVFGDEFTGRSIAQVIDNVDRINAADADGNRRVRIHAIGFPVVFEAAPRQPVTGIRFATLMRELTQRNDGAFVGLTTID
ncbi:MAG: vWA domain-containing protein [Pseudomonadales bacterium]